ncbi:MAG: glycosyltransferase family 39 protein [Gammaproteobacteria bacterium]
MARGVRISPAAASWPALLCVWLAALAAALVWRPLLPVDETRYATVAWEMWQRGDFLVPYLNGEPYSHKPPLYFWLIHAGWWLFGVKEWVVRAIAPLVTLACLVATAFLARQLWPGERLLARLAPWVLFSAFPLMAFYTWVQFDMLLVLATLLAMTGFIQVSRGRRRGWVLVGGAIGMGVLAKGPVILLHVLPAGLLAPLWKRADSRRSWIGWYAGLALSVLLGALLALAWALPAAEAGGEAYRQAILWGQTADRLVASFAHAHPVWWYLPWLAVLFAPWCYLPWVWVQFRQLRPARDPGVRFCLVWLLAVFVLMSLVSGKQVKYLLPLLPAFALLLVRLLATMEPRPVMQRPWILGGLLLALGVAAMLLPGRLDEPAWLAAINPAWAGLLVAVALVIMIVKPLRPASYPVYMTLISALVAGIVPLGVFRAGAHAYDMHAVSRVIGEAQSSGRTVAMLRGYHGQFGFEGRLTAPIHTFGKGQSEQWARQHPDDYLVVISGEPFAADSAALFTQPYRGGYLGVFTGEAVLRNSKDLLE